jgi:tetratricopeptide (TPR) repeat protein
MLRTALRLLLGPLLALALAVPATSDDFTDTETLNALFEALAEAPDEYTARVIDQQIWVQWTTPKDPDLALRMMEALELRRMGDPVRTIAVLNAMIEDYPGYAEGWNQRATMYYLVGDYEASIADCAKVLELEPRHFGALSGRALMYLQLGKRSLALKDMAKAVSIHPFLTERRLFPELEEDEMTRI